MTTEQIEWLKSHGFEIDPELYKLRDVPMFEEKLAEANEFLLMAGVPIIENGKIIGKRMIPDAVEEVMKEKIKNKEYKLEPGLSSLIEEPSIVIEKINLPNGKVIIPEKIAKEKKILSKVGLPFDKPKKKKTIISIKKK